MAKSPSNLLGKDVKLVGVLPCVCCGARPPPFRNWRDEEALVPLSGTVSGSVR
jgi:hypothetical protein